MERKKIRDLKTSELLDKVHMESIKDKPDEMILEKISEELSNRFPFNEIWGKIDSHFEILNEGIHDDSC